MDLAGMASSLAASPRAHLLSASYSPLKAVAQPGAGGELCLQVIHAAEPVRLDTN